MNAYDMAHERAHKASLETLRDWGMTLSKFRYQVTFNKDGGFSVKPPERKPNRRKSNERKNAHQ